MAAAASAGDKPTGTIEWVPDSEAPRCMECAVKFGLRTRKHHCRACGKVFCGKCSGNKIVVPNSGVKEPQRACIKCFQRKLREDEERYREEEHKRLKEEQRAEQQRQHDEDYVSSIYDTDGLIVEILRYLQGGCELTHVSSAGVRKRCRFWLHRSPPTLCWTDPEVIAKGVAAAKKAIPAERRSLTLAKSVTLGPYTKSLKRIATPQEHYLSFTVELQRGPETEHIDCIAEQLVDFEAWVLGLAHLLRVDPQWGEPLKLDKDKRAKELDAKEKEHLAKYHIPPSLYFDARDLFKERAAEVQHQKWLFDGDMEKVWLAVGGPVEPVLDEHGALLVTKGELRFETDLDVFRASSLWRLLASQRIIFDPYYRPATGKGSEDPHMKGYGHLELPEPSSTERRVDPADGRSYTKQEFIAEYGGTKEWDAANTRPRAQTTAGDLRRTASQGSSRERGGSQRSRGTSQGSGEGPPAAAAAAPAAAAPAAAQPEPPAAAAAPAAPPQSEAAEAPAAAEQQQQQQQDEGGAGEAAPGGAAEGAGGADDEERRKVPKRLARLLVASAAGVLAIAAWHEQRAARKREKRQRKETMLRQQEGAAAAAEGEAAAEGAGRESGAASPASEEAPAAEREPEWSAEGRAKVEAILAEHAPKRLKKLQKLLGEWEGRETELLAALHEQFGIEP